MLDSIFFSSDQPYRLIAEDIYYIFGVELFIWVVFFNAVFPFGVKWHYAKYISRPLSIVLGLSIGIIGNLQFSHLGKNNLSFLINTELLSLFLSFLFTQIFYIELEKTIFGKKIRKKEIRWFLSKK